MTHPMLTWYLAQLDADEAIAQRIIEDSKRSSLRRWLKLDVQTEDGDTTTIQHLKVYEPEAALADIVAKRAIIVEHEEYVSQGGHHHEVCARCTPEGSTGYEPYPCRTVHLLATAYAGRPGFEPQWAVFDDAERW